MVARAGVCRAATAIRSSRDHTGLPSARQRHDQRPARQRLARIPLALPDAARCPAQTVRRNRCTRSSRKLVFFADKAA